MTIFDLNTGALAPVRDESDIAAPRVTGTIPRELDGVWVRNGPNPLNGRFEGNDVLSWWPEAAMLHAVAFEDGKVAGYRNRWLRTPRWARVHEPGRAPALPDTNPNVSVLHHAGEILALAEGGAPLAVTTSLETLGEPSRHRGLAGGTTAHPKVDAHTGELMTFRSHWQAPWLRYGVTDAEGRQLIDLEIEVPAPAMMHDMAITATHSLLLDLNVAYDFSMLSRGHRMPLRWHDDRRSRIGVIPRHGGAVRWFEVTPCFVQHVVNAYDASSSTIVLDVVRYPSFLRLSNDGGTFEPNPTGTFWRYVIDMAAERVTERQMGDIGIELPRIDERRTGRPYRFLYATGQPDATSMRGIVRYDVERGTVVEHRIGSRDSNGEPVFVPRADGAPDDEGWILVCVYRSETDTSDLLILDAQAIEREPVATVHLPRRIPAGFHGAWLPNRK